MNAYRLIVCDHYLCFPIRGLDVTYSEFRGSDVKQVPIIRIFGSTLDGRKSCVHVHGVFPYIYIPYEGSESADKLKYLLSASLDKAINISLGQTNSSTQHVYKISLVSGVPFYGYHEKEHQFFKIYLYNPNLVKRTSELLQNGSVMNKVHQPYEAHLPFILQFMIDYNLQGMNLVNYLTEDQMENMLIAEDAPLKVSVCEVEVDVQASDILNRNECLSQTVVNPGLAALWEDEQHRRRAQGRNSQPTPQFSQTREQHSCASEDFYRQRLLLRLQELSQDNSMSTQLSGNCVPYPAETSEGESLLSASVVEQHTPRRNPFADDTDNTLVADENRISTTNNCTLFMTSQDEELLNVLEEMAMGQSQTSGADDTNQLINIKQEPEDDDCILSSQQPIEDNCYYLPTVIKHEEEDELEDLEMTQPFVSSLEPFLQKSEAKDAAIEAVSPFPDHNITLISSQNYESAEKLLLSLLDSESNPISIRSQESDPREGPSGLNKIFTLKSNPGDSPSDLNTIFAQESNPGESPSGLNKIFTQESDPGESPSGLNKKISQESDPGEGSNDFNKLFAQESDPGEGPSGFNKLFIQEADPGEGPSGLQTAMCDQRDSGDEQPSSQNSTLGSLKDFMLNDELWDEWKIPQVDGADDDDDDDTPIIAHKGRRLGARGPVIGSKALSSSSLSQDSHSTHTHNNSMVSSEVLPTFTTSSIDPQSTPEVRSTVVTASQNCLNGNSQNNVKCQDLNQHEVAENVNSAMVGDNNSEYRMLLEVVESQNVDELEVELSDDYLESKNKIIKFLKSPSQEVSSNGNKASKSVSSSSKVAVQTVSSSSRPDPSQSLPLDSVPRMSEELVNNICSILDTYDISETAADSESHLSELYIPEGSAALQLLEEEFTASEVSKNPQKNRRSQSKLSLRNRHNRNRSSCLDSNSHPTPQCSASATTSSRNATTSFNTTRAPPVLTSNISTNLRNPLRTSVLNLVPDRNSNTFPNCKATLETFETRQRTSQNLKLHKLNFETSIPMNKRSLITLDIRPNTVASKHVKLEFLVEDVPPKSRVTRRTRPRTKPPDLRESVARHEQIETKLPNLKDCSVRLERLPQHVIELYKCKGNKSPKKKTKDSKRQRKTLEGTPTSDLNDEYSISKKRELISCPLLIESRKQKGKPEEQNLETHSIIFSENTNPITESPIANNSSVVTNDDQAVQTINSPRDAQRNIYADDNQFIESLPARQTSSQLNDGQRTQTIVGAGRSNLMDDEPENIGLQQNRHTIVLSEESQATQITNTPSNIQNRIRTNFSRLISDVSHVSPESNMQTTLSDDGNDKGAIASSVQETGDNTSETLVSICSKSSTVFGNNDTSPIEISASDVDHISESQQSEIGKNSVTTDLTSPIQRRLSINSSDSYDNSSLNDNVLSVTLKNSLKSSQDKSSHLEKKSSIKTSQESNFQLTQRNLTNVSQKSSTKVPQKNSVLLHQENPTIGSQKNNLQVVQHIKKHGAKSPEESHLQLSHKRKRKGINPLKTQQKNTTKLTEQKNHPLKTQQKDTTKLPEQKNLLSVQSRIPPLEIHIIKSSEKELRNRQYSVSLLKPPSLPDTNPKAVPRRKLNYGTPVTSEPVEIFHTESDSDLALGKQTRSKTKQATRQTISTTKTVNFDHSVMSSTSSTESTFIELAPSQLSQQSKRRRNMEVQKRLNESANISGETWEGHTELPVPSPPRDHIKDVHRSKNGVGHFVKKGPDKNKTLFCIEEENEELITSFYNYSYVSPCAGVLSCDRTSVSSCARDIKCTSSVFEPLLNPPSWQEIYQSLAEYDLNDIKFQDPFYSVASDVQKQREVGGRVIKLISNSVSDLPHFNSIFSLSVPSNSLTRLTSLIVIEPLYAAPSSQEVCKYAVDQKEKTVGVIEGKLKIQVPVSPGREDSDKESLSLSPCSETDNRPWTPISGQMPPVLSSTPLIHTKLPRYLTPTRRSSTQSDSWCKLDGPSPLNNTFGFRVANNNLQEARALVQPQQLTVLTLELHISTRGELRPDPDRDAIGAVFFMASSDDGCGVSELGVITLAMPGLNVASLQAPGRQNAAVILVSSECDIILETVRLVRHWDPDILMGYEIEMESWGYLIQRAAQLEINLINLLSRVPKKDKQDQPQHTATGSQGALITEFSDVRITGRIVLNLWRLLRHEVALQSYVFENVVFHILHERVPHYSFRSLTYWWNHPSGLYRWIVVDYWTYRVKGCSTLVDRLDLLGRTAELAKLFGIQFYEVLSRGSQFRVESMMLRLAKPRNFVPVSPSQFQRAHMRAPESLPLILEPESRYYVDPVIVLDFQSLYPSVIIAYNYCFSTCLGRVEHLGQEGPFEFGCTQLRVPRRLVRRVVSKCNVSPCGVAYVKREVREGVLPRMLREILDARLMVKKSMKENKEDETLQRVLHARQLGLKLIANVTYGYTAANFSGRMPCIEVGDSVVSKGRETLDNAIQMVRDRPEWGARVIYGDTDSMFVLVPGRTRQQAFEIGTQIAAAVTAANPSPVKLKLEKVYQPCILQTKKRYVGFMYESPDQKSPVYEAKGIETVRRDGCPAVSKILEKSLRFLFETQDVSMIKKYVTRQFQKIIMGRANLQDLVFAKEFRGFSGYKPGACVPALELARQWVRGDRRAEPRRGERVPYVVVSGAPGLPLIRLVRSPHDLLRDPGLRINAEYYITRAISPALDRCLSLIGADVYQWFHEMPRRTSSNLPTAGPLQGKSCRTISQYFATIECVVCRLEQTREGICTSCLAKPRMSAFTLMSKIKRWERTTVNINKLCKNCCGHNLDVECTSLVCPLLFRRVQASRDVLQAPYLRQLLIKYFDF